MENQRKNNETGTQSIERAISILNCFLGEMDSLSLSNIAKKTGIPIPTASRITRFLAQNDYLARNGEGRSFKVGRRLYMLGYRAKKLDVLRNVIYDTLTKLKNEFGETATAYIRDGSIRRCFEKVEADHDFHYAPTVGAEYNIGVGAGAKAFLAFLDTEERESAINSIIPLTPYTVTDIDKILKELEEIRATMIARSFGEYCLEFSSLASPIFDSDGEVICTIAITGPTSRFTPEMIQEAEQRIVSYCLTISSEF
ncbi:MAG: IclR family transcriptional regulator, partial [Synergistaceae bacterium]|nr:IclR family transcriptional regulator [Synergistaceae bacterium]